MSKVAFGSPAQYINAQTGEVFDALNVVQFADGGDSGFDKIWLGAILELVDEVGTAKMRVLLWMLQNRDSKNVVRATKAEIADATGVGRATITRLLSALRGADVISEVRRSAWRLNPSVIWRGDRPSRMRVMFEYRDERAEAQPDLFEAPAEPQSNVLPLHVAA